MPLPPFIQATVKKDLSFLIIPGQAEVEQPTSEALNTAWLDINSEYVEIVGDVDTAAYASDLNRQTELQARLLRFKMVVLALREYPAPELIAILTEEDFGVSLDPADPEQFGKDLDRVLVELVQDEIELEKLLEKDDKSDEEKAKKPNPVTEAHYDKILLEISHKDNEGVRYTAKDLTVREYAILLNRLTKRRRG